jgi:hypothetical protein
MVVAIVHDDDLAIQNLRESRKKYFHAFPYMQKIIPTVIESKRLSPLGQASPPEPKITML